MKVRRISTVNFRSLENFQLDFDGSYCAISGKNNSGKTNLIRAIRSVIPERDVFERDEIDGLVFSKNFPAWKKRDGGVVCVSLLAEVFRDEDIGLHEFIRKFSPTAEGDASPSLLLEMTLTSAHSATTDKPVVRVNNVVVEEVAAAEILRKVQTSGAIIFHNATDSEGAMYRYGPYDGGTLGEFASSDKTSFEDVQNKIDRLIQRLAKKHQADVAALIGKLEDKYSVGLTVARTNLKWMPMQISLGTRKTSLPLDDWGSGTRNRTEIILALLKAKKASESANLADRLKPVVVVEEPESFLHPSAQAEFGRVLRELTHELGLQVIVTTHSPYLLSMEDSRNNVLLERASAGKELRETRLVPADDENWMGPFALALGIDNREFDPWKSLLRGGSRRALMVEGETDVAFLELLKDPGHGESRLRFDGEIIPYGGCSALQNTAVLKLVLSQSEKCVITYDLDSAKDVEGKLGALGLSKNRDYISVGRDVAGYRDIEGLVPDVIRKEVFQANPVLVSALTSNITEERRKAKEELKRKLFAAFKSSQLDRSVVFAEFYKLASALNKCFASK